MARLDGLQVSPEDIFYETARLLDFLVAKPDTDQYQVNSLWNILMIDVRKWKADTTDYDKRMVADTVFQVVRASLTQFYDSHYSETICDLLGYTIERERKGFDKQEDKDEYSEFCNRLIEQSPKLSEWINQYDNADEWLSDLIAEAIGSSGEKEEEPNTKAAVLTQNKEFMRILQKAVEQGFCTQQGWQYKWENRGDSALFASIASHKFHLSKRHDRDGDLAISWKPFEALFGEKNLRSVFNDWQNGKYSHENEKTIEKLLR